MKARIYFWIVAFSALPLTAQTPYSLSVSVNEVSLTFHAADDHGLPRNDLTPADLHILDNGRAPARILSFHVLRDIPIRAGILFDTSVSMGSTLTQNRDIALKYTQSLLRQSTDQAFIMNFGRASRLIQPWTSDSNTLALSLRRISGYGERTCPGTAIYDAVYQACHTLFGAIDHASTGNFLLLFSDGEDNGSRLTLA